MHTYLCFLLIDPDVPLSSPFFFFLMIRRPPRSTLFPYTNALPISLRQRVGRRPQLRRRQCRSRARVLHRQRRIRSEEHTSELQSHSDLVCRLLLEKKKKKTQKTYKQQVKNNQKCSRRRLILERHDR